MNQPKNCKNIPFLYPLTLPSLLFHAPSIPKHICFGLQKTVFYHPKDGLLEGESLSFAG